MEIEKSHSYRDKSAFLCLFLLGLRYVRLAGCLGENAKGPQTQRALRSLCRPTPTEAQGPRAQWWNSAAEAACAVAVQGCLAEFESCLPIEQVSLRDRKIRTRMNKVSKEDFPLSSIDKLAGDLFAKVHPALTANGGIGHTMPGTHQWRMSYAWGHACVGPAIFIGPNRWHSHDAARE